MENLKETFRYFVRKNYEEASKDLGVEEIDELGVEFHSHLRDKLDDDAWETIVPNNSMDLIMKIGHPFKINGFHPAYVLHFSEWIEKMSQEQE